MFQLWARMVFHVTAKTPKSIRMRTQACAVFLPAAAVTPSENHNLMVLVIKRRDQARRRDATPVLI